MSVGSKTKAAGLATGGVLAALYGFADDCARVASRPLINAGDDLVRVGDDAVLAGTAADDLAVTLGDDVARFAAPTEVAGSDLARSGFVLGSESSAPTGTGIVSRLRSARWGDLTGPSRSAGTRRIAGDVAEEAVQWAPDAVDLGAGLLDGIESEDGSTLTIPSLADLVVFAPAVAAICPLEDAASDDDRSIRRELSHRGVTLLDTPDALAEVLESRPRPLLVLARTHTDGDGLLAPDGSALGVAYLLGLCRAAGSECVVLSCASSAPECTYAAYAIASGSLLSAPPTLPRLWAELADRRDHDVDGSAITLSHLDADGDRVDDAPSRAY